LPGLCVEALTFEELEKRLSDLIPGLLILNHIIEESGNKPIQKISFLGAAKLFISSG
jgi:hypothetical protein